MQSDQCPFCSLFTAIECITLKVVYADVNASKTSKQAELILLVAFGIFRGCGFKEYAIILEKGLFFCSRSMQHLGEQQYINFDCHRW